MPSRSYAQVAANTLVYNDRSYPPSNDALETNRKNEVLNVANGLESNATSSLPIIDWTSVVVCESNPSSTSCPGISTSQGWFISIF